MLAQIQTRKERLVEDLERVRQEVATKQKLFTELLSKGFATDHVEAELAAVQAKQSAIVGAIDQLDDEAELAVKRDKEADKARADLKKLNAELDREAVLLMKDAYAVYDRSLELIALHQKALQLNRIANPGSTGIQSESVHVVRSLEQSLRAAMTGIERVSKTIWKHTKHHRITPGFKK